MKVANLLASKLGSSTTAVPGVSDASTSATDASLREKGLSNVDQWNVTSEQEMMGTNCNCRTTPHSSCSGEKITPPRRKFSSIGKQGVYEYERQR